MPIAVFFLFAIFPTIEHSFHKHRRSLSPPHTSLLACPTPVLPHPVPRSAFLAGWGAEKENLGVFKGFLLHHPHPELGGDTRQVQWGHLNAATNSQEPGLGLHTHGVRLRLIPTQMHQILAELMPKNDSDFKPFFASDLKPFRCLSPSFLSCSDNSQCH